MLCKKALSACGIFHPFTVSAFAFLRILNVKVFPKSSRGHTFAFFENIAEIIGALEAAERGDTGDGFVAFGKEKFRFFKSQTGKVCHGCES